MNDEDAREVHVILCRDTPLADVDAVRNLNVASENQMVSRWDRVLLQRAIECIMNERKKHDRVLCRCSFATLQASSHAVYLIDSSHHNLLVVLATCILALPNHALDHLPATTTMQKWICPLLWDGSLLFQLRTDDDATTQACGMHLRQK
jgi:hypothetical protein